MKRYPAVALVAAMLLATTGCEWRGDEAAPDVVIGADLELSGGGTELGAAYERALRLKVEQVNRLGLLGDRRLELRVRDNRTDPRTSEANFTELAEDPAVSVMISGGCADCVLSAMDTIAGSRLPTISLAVPGAVTTPAEQRRYVFKLAPNLVDDAAALVAELRRAGARKVAVIATDDKYGGEALAAVRGEARKSSMTVVSEQFRAAEAASVSSAPSVGRIVDAKPDAVVVLAFAPVAGQIAKLLRAAKFKKDLYFDAPAAGELFLSGEGAAASDGASLVFTQTLVTDDTIATSPAKVARKAWFRDYVSAYGSYAAFASFAADAVQLVVDAVNRVGTDREALRSAFEQVRFDGLSGPIRMTPDNHSGLMPQALAILVARDGRWRLAS